MHMMLSMSSMLGVKILFLLPLLVCFTQAAVISTHQVHERRSSPPSGWTRRHRLDSTAILPIRIGLKQSNLDNLHDLLMQVSHPDSPEYGQHWSPQKVQSSFAPSKETRSEVLDWLVASGISPSRIHPHQTSSLGWVTFNATVAQAEALFDTQYHAWTHPLASNEAPFPGVAEHYSLPAHIRPHVDFITPTLHFDISLNNQKRHHHQDYSRGSRIQYGRPGSPGAPTLRKYRPFHFPSQLIHVLEQCDKYTTPVCIRALYGIPPLPPQISTNKKNSIGVLEITLQQYSPSDLIKFFGNYSQNQVQKAPTLVSIDGGTINSPVTPDPFLTFGESNLDFQYIMTLVNPLPVTLYQLGDAVGGASFNNWLDAFDASYCGGDDYDIDTAYPDTQPGGYTGPEACGTLSAAKVISISYASDEVEFLPAYLTRQCKEYGKLSLMGSTFVFATGDHGVAGATGNCINAASGRGGTPNDPKFNPTFPASCPYVLSVGGTQINPGSNIFQPESSSSKSLDPGGGFSNVFAMPSYQAAAVKGYLAKHPPPYSAAQYNNSGLVRAYPDVSANADDYATIVDGEWTLQSGTSASAPVFAAVLSLINEARLDIGKGTVGFVNPALYANPSMLNDITTGLGNGGCGTTGFAVSSGWDPVTGLGTPSFPRMLQYFLKH